MTLRTTTKASGKHFFCTLNTLILIDLSALERCVLLLWENEQSCSIVRESEVFAPGQAVSVDEVIKYRGHTATIGKIGKHEQVILYM